MIDYSQMKGNIFDQTDISQILGVTEDEIISLIKSERVPAKVIGQKYFLTRSNFRRFLSNANIGEKPSKKAETKMIRSSVCKLL